MKEGMTWKRGLRFEWWEGKLPPDEVKFPPDGAREDRWIRQPVSPRVSEKLRWSGISWSPRGWA